MLNFVFLPSECPTNFAFLIGIPLQDSDSDLQVCFGFVPFFALYHACHYHLLSSFWYERWMTKRRSRYRYNEHKHSNIQTTHSWCPLSSQPSRRVVFHKYLISFSVRYFPSSAFHILPTSAISASLHFDFCPDPNNR
jgi:hypothetical protein